MSAYPIRHTPAPRELMAFNPDRFKRDLVYRARAKLGTILSEVSQIEGFDAAAEAKLARFKQIRIVVVLAAVAIGAASGWKFADSSDGFGFAVIGGVLSLLVVGGISGAMLGSFQRLDLTDRRYRWINKVLTRLATDMHADAKFEIKVDFEPIDSSRKVKRTGRRGRYSVQHIFDPWLTLRGQFMDGTRFEFTVEEEIESRVHAKGHKRKLKRRTTLKLLLRPKEKRYGGLDQLGEGVEDVVQLPAGLRLGRFQVAKGRISISAVKKHKSFNNSPRYALDLDKSMSLMFLSGYQVLNLSRRMTRRGRSAATGAPTGRRLGAPSGSRPSGPTRGGLSAPAGRRPSPSGSMAPAALFENLVLAAAIDRKLETGEKQALLERASRLGLSREFVNATIRRVATHELVSYRLPADPETRGLVLDEMAALMRADGRVGAREERVLRTLAARMELSDERLAQALTGGASQPNRTR